MSLSWDGFLLAVGGPTDKYGVGATWLFEYNGSGYTQIGNKLVRTGNENNSHPWQGKDKEDHMKVGLVVGKEIMKYPGNHGIRHPK